MTDPRTVWVMRRMVGWLVAEVLPLDILKFRRREVECSGGRQR